MPPGLTINQVQDFSCSLRVHLLPEFGNLPLDEFRPIRLKNYVAKLKTYRKKNGKPQGATFRNGIAIILILRSRRGCGPPSKWP
jgi:hypothetical protein